MVADSAGTRPRSCSAEASKVGSASPLDIFDEVLQLHPIPPTPSSSLVLAHFDFSIRAALSSAFRSDQFDLFPKPIGKLLNAHGAIRGFEVALTQGRWKEQWGAPPREIRPPGALLAVATGGNSGQSEADDAWKFLISALSGSLCASFEGMDPHHKSLAWVVPLDVPFREDGNNLRLATLPYEPVCTENLTPWLKLLPCGGHRGLAALLAPIAIAEAPLVSLTLAVSVEKDAVLLRTSLDVVLPAMATAQGFDAWFGSSATQGSEPCQAARNSSVYVIAQKALEPEVLQELAVEPKPIPGGGSVLPFQASEFAKLSRSANQALLSGATTASSAHVLAAEANTHGLSVMRDILSQEGYSERTHGRYLLRFTNHGSVAKRVRFMDQLPFFLTPMWHTFHTSLQHASGAVEELSGLDAMRRLSVQFVPPSRPHDATEVFLSADVAPGASVSVFLDVLKNFIQLREFSYACEKGFDVSAAAWMEVDLPQLSNSSGISDFLKSLAPSVPWENPDTASQWRLRFTQGLIILVPMPDFSMPFNVIALSATALTFFFGSIFRLTAAGRLQHWVLKKEAVPGKKWLTSLKRAVVLGLLGGFYYLSQLSPKEIQAFRIHLEPLGIPDDLQESIIQFLLSTRETATKLGL